MTAGGLSRTLGTMYADLYLTPTAHVRHSFIVSQNSATLLIGGDILADHFWAIHFSKDRTFHLYGVGMISMDDPCSWDDETPLAMQCTVLEPTEQEALTLKYTPAIAKLEQDFAEVFVSQGAALKAQPPCPSPQPWDFDVTLMAEPSRRPYSRAASGDPVQTAFFAKWITGMTSSGRRANARWNNAITRAQGEVYYVAPARAIKKHDGDYSGPIETWDLRVVVDYREVNANTALPGRTSCPNISTLLNSIAKKKYKSKLDLRHGFFNVGIANEKTRRCFAFSTPQGIFLPNVMPMGAKGSPDALMNMMHTIFETLCAI